MAQPRKRESFARRPRTSRKSAWTGRFGALGRRDRAAAGGSRRRVEAPAAPALTAEQETQLTTLVKASRGDGPSDAVKEAHAAYNAAILAGDLAGALSFSRQLSERFSIGISAKYIQQTIWHESANG